MQVQPKVGKSKFLFCNTCAFVFQKKNSGSRAERREVPVLLLVTFLAVMFLLAIPALLCFCGIRAQNKRNSKPGIIHHPGPGAQPPRGSSTNELWTSPTEREQHEHWNNQAFMNDISSRTCPAMCATSLAIKSFLPILNNMLVGLDSDVK